jgi:hypothetical protein
MTDQVDRKPRHRCSVSRPIPLFDERGRQIRVVRPGTRGTVVGEYDGSGPGVPLRNRALVRFDDDPTEDWDISRDSIVVTTVL